MWSPYTGVRAAATSPWIISTRIRHVCISARLEPPPTIPHAAPVGSSAPGDSTSGLPSRRAFCSPSPCRCSRESGPGWRQHCEKRVFISYRARRLVVEVSSQSIERPHLVSLQAASSPSIRVYTLRR
jgi:hypothetical protein